MRLPARMRGRAKTPWVRGRSEQVQQESHGLTQGSTVDDGATPIVRRSIACQPRQLGAILHAISDEMRLVLDTDAMVAAIRSEAGASRRLLQFVLERRSELRMLVSVPLLIEYEAVMTRPEHLRAARVSVADVGALLDAVAALAEPV